MERWHLTCLQKIGGSDTFESKQDIQWTCFTDIILEPFDGPPWCDWRDLEFGPSFGGKITDKWVSGSYVGGIEYNIQMQELFGFKILRQKKRLHVADSLLLEGHRVLESKAFRRTMTKLFWCDPKKLQRNCPCFCHMSSKINL